MEKICSFTLAAGNGWKKDPLNSALPYMDASNCEIAATLNGISKIRILGMMKFTLETSGDDVKLHSQRVGGN